MSDFVIKDGELKKYNGSENDVVIPNDVTSIGDEAFGDCDSMTSVIIPDGVTSIGEWAFGSCSSLTSVTIPNSVTSIGDEAFRDCDSLTSISIPNSVASIGEYAFCNCSSLTNITIPEGVTEIQCSTFDGCYKLKCVVIPDGVTSIGERAFFSCKNICNIIIPNSVSSIGIEAFEFCESLTSITIPEGVLNVESCAFTGCKHLTSISIPNSVTSIGCEAFVGCNALKTLTIHGNITKIGDRAFAGCLIEHMDVPQSFLEIDYKVLKESGILPSLCTSGIEISNKRLKDAAIRETKKQHKIFREIVSRDSVEILSRVLTLCKFDADEVDVLLSSAQEANAVGCIATLLDYKSNHFSAQEMEAQLEKQIGISERSLKEWKKTLKLSVKDGKIAVGGYAGIDSKTVKEIEIPNEIEGMPIVEIKDNAFREMHNLTKITIPEGVVRIGKYAFACCWDLSEIVLPDSVEEIGNRAFENCGLKEIHLSSNVKKMGSEVFLDCSANVIAPAGSYAEDYVNPAPIKVVDGVLVRCNVHGSVTIPDGVTECADRVFCYPYGADITIPDSVQKISTKAFYYCKDITIHGKAGSCAEKIAKKMKFDFVAE